MSVSVIPPLANPCPDMPHYALSHEDKVRGLASLQKVRAQMREEQLARLYSRRSELVQHYEESNKLSEQQRIRHEIRKIDLQATHISERWS